MPIEEHLVALASTHNVEIERQVYVLRNGHQPSRSEAKDFVRE